MSTIKKIPREQAVEAIFNKIISSPKACRRLCDTFYDHLNEENIYIDNNAQHFSKILFSAYENQDISALLLEISQRSMFDLLREAFLIPKRFHGKAGKNPILLTDVEGNLLDSLSDPVTNHEYSKFKEIFGAHNPAPRSKLYLADGYDIVRSFTDDLEIEESLTNKRRGILNLYALPDTASLGLTEAQAYAVIWDAFWKIQEIAPSAMVYYGQETGEKSNKKFDEIGILLPLHHFSGHIKQHLIEIDGIILSCREDMMKHAGKDSLDL